MRLRSSAFSDNDMLPARFARDADNVSPALEWDGAPDGAVELALVCEDLDAPGGSFVHWALLHIDPGVTSVGEGETPPGATELDNDYGETGWGGPQPPVGDDPHRYAFRVFALGERMSMSDDTDGAAALRSLHEYAVAAGTLIGRFAR